MAFWGFETTLFNTFLVQVILGRDNFLIEAIVTSSPSHSLFYRRFNIP